MSCSECDPRNAFTLALRFRTQTCTCSGCARRHSRHLARYLSQFRLWYSSDDPLFVRLVMRLIGGSDLLLIGDPELLALSAYLFFVEFRVPLRSRRKARFAIRP